MKKERRNFLKSIATATIGLSISTGPVGADDTSEFELTENQIKFAKGELPNYLRNTIVDGSQRVVVTDSGDVPDNYNHNDYDLAISHRELDRIEEEAIDRYIDEFSVDPSNPEVDIVDGRPIHVDEVAQLVETGEITLTRTPPTTETTESTSIQSQGTSTGPRAVDGRVYLRIVPASNSYHSPSESYRSDTSNAWAIFGLEFDVETRESIHFGYWDASGNGTDTYDLLRDFENEAAQFQENKNDVVTGWVDQMDNNGVANRDGHFSVNACKAVGGTDWDHERIVQHELSHNFNAPDRGTWGYQHEKCIMNYEYAYRGIDYWCNEDRGIVDDNINYI